MVVRAETGYHRGVVKDYLDHTTIYSTPVRFSFPSWILHCFPLNKRFQACSRDDGYLTVSMRENDGSAQVLLVTAITCAQIINYRPHEVIILLTPSPWRTVCLAMAIVQVKKIHIISIQSHTARIYVCPPMSFTIIFSQMMTLCMCSRSIIGSMQCISNSLAAGSNPDPDAEVGTAGGRLVRVKMARKRRRRDIIVASLCTSCTVYMKIFYMV